LNAAPKPAAATRVLGFWMCTALVVGNIIGIGIFVMPAALAPFGLNALTAWLITVTGCLFLALTFASLARTFPQDDGPYGYTRRAFGEATAFIAMWCYWVSTWVTNAVIAIGVVGYVSVFVPVLDRSPWLPPLTALSFLWFFVLINLYGARSAGWMQLSTTLLKLLPQAGIMVLGVWLLFTQPQAYTAHLPSTPASLHAVIGASTIALFAMLGIECAAIPAGLVTDPARTIPRATVTGTLIAALIYMGISVVPMLLIPQQELAASNAPFADLFARFLGSGYGKLLAAFVVVSGLGALNGWTLIVGDVTRSFARHGRFPQALGQVNAHAAPTRAFVLTGIVASVMMLMNYNQSLASGFTFLSVVVTAANLPVYLSCSLALIVLWRRGQIPHQGKRAALWALFALLAALYCAWVSIGIGLNSLLWALGLGAVGVPVYLWSTYAQRRIRQQRHGD
jgi:basic amino acid/polyamine antiporter, APA family